MTYIAAEARQRLLDTIGEAADELGAALGALTEAYELLDDDSADRMEEALFQPVQAAFGRAQRTHAGFAERHNMTGRTFAAESRLNATRGARTLIEAALEALNEAELILTELQDSMLPVEVGDPELRTGLAEVRQAMSSAGDAGHRFIGLMGR
jgi:hypothetical protein